MTDKRETFKRLKTLFKSLEEPPKLLPEKYNEMLHTRNKIPSNVAKKLENLAAKKSEMKTSIIKIIGKIFVSPQI
jgi:argonaute-like protein implicated in RNA metabolism and viral defense